MNNRYATLEYICKPDRPFETLLPFLNEKSLHNLALTNQDFSRHYSAWSEIKRDHRVKELNELESESFEIPINEGFFPVLGFEGYWHFSAEHIKSLSILPTSIMVPAKTPFFIGYAKINWKNKNEYDAGVMEFLVDCTYPSDGPMQLKRRNLNSDTTYFNGATCCTDTKKKMLIISRKERRVCDFHALMPELKVIGADLDYTIDVTTIMHNEQGEHEVFTIGSKYPGQIWLICKKNGDIVLERDCFQRTDLFGELSNLGSLSKSVRKHVRNSTEAKTYTTEYKNEGGIIKKTNHYLLQRKETDSSWAPGVLQALRPYVLCRKNSYQKYDSLSTDDCAKVVIALVLEQEPDTSTHILHHHLINKKIWATIQGTNKEVNAINRARHKNNILGRLLTGYEYAEESTARGFYDSCLSVISSTLLSPDTVSFTDGTKITPLKLCNMIQKKANENAALLAQTKSGMWSLFGTE